MATLITKVFIFILGSAVGSFLNVLIDRLPKNEKITGWSHCDNCKEKLRWYDLIPVFSFVFLRGKCRYCHKKLSWQYPIVEMVTGIALVYVLSFRPSEARGGIFLSDPSTSLPLVASLRMTAMLGIISCLIVVFFSDLKYHLISDYILLALFGFSILDKFFNNITIQQYSNFFISGLIVALPIFLIYYFSRERAMGLGDVYLSAITGFLLSWKVGYLALYIAFVTGAIFGSFLIVLHKKKLKSKIPFGPFIVIGTMVMLFWGEKIMEIIKRLYGF